ncbi:hypothetical protein MHUMG1_09502 [Metarhizium humberi]|uniref:Uncharacterized protein n=1 Tax=Metarhizium humberi TaxID=2596975 RepID=A0A9P8S345_9HYPO|nr:hypothetical protein MHUMG1_09502 [Metarhizium humberi]
MTWLTSTHNLEGARQALNTAITELGQAQSRVKTQEDEVKHQVWHEISLCYNPAKSANSALTKADYATAILKIVDVSTEDPMDQSILTGIVDELANYDDSNGSVGKIKTEEHKNGLLDYVQKKLQQGIGQDTMMAGSSGKNPVRELPVEARLKLIRSMVGALVKPQGQPGSMDISDVERVDLLSALSGLFVLGSAKA